MDRTAAEFIKTLVRDTSPRESATDQELRAAEYLAKEFESLGYSTNFQYFNVEMITPESSSLTVTPGPPLPLEVVPLRRATPGLGAGPLEDVGLARLSSIPAGSLAGKVALAQRGEITFQEKIETVAGEGAVAAIIYNNEPGSFQGTLSERSSIPAVSVSQVDGEKLLALLAQGEVHATLSVRENKLPSRNLVAEKPGSPGEVDQREVVIIGAHYDTVANTEGANDNSTGMASLLILAEKLASRALPFRIRFIAFGSEELGLFGSRAYVDSLSDEEVDGIAAMLNFDALGAGPNLTILGSIRLTRLGAGIAEANEIPLTVREEFRGGASDHASFARYDIPVLMFTASDYSRINSPMDTLEFVQPELVADSVRLALGMLESADFPP